MEALLPTRPAGLPGRHGTHDVLHGPWQPIQPRRFGTGRRAFGHDGGPSRIDGGAARGAEHRRLGEEIDRLEAPARAEHEPAKHR